MWDESEDDWPDEEGPDFDEDSPTVSCPECGSDVYEESGHCPSCGHFLVSSSSSPLLGKPGWFVILGFLGLIATLIAIGAMP